MCFGPRKARFYLTNNNLVFTKRVKKKVALIYTPIKIIIKYEIVVFFKKNKGWSKLNNGIDSF